MNNYNSSSSLLNMVRPICCCDKNFSNSIRTMTEVTKMFKNINNTNKKMNKYFYELSAVNLEQKKMIQLCKNRNQLYKSINKNFSSLFDKLKKAQERHKTCFIDDKDIKFLKDLANKSWFLAFVDFPFDLTLAFSDLRDAYYDKEHAFEEYLMTYYRDAADNICESLVKQFSQRKDILEASFNAHKESKYELSVPVLLTQIDGISYDLMNGCIATGGGRSKILGSINENNLYKKIIKEFLAPESKIYMFKNDHEVNNSDLHRHKILHGKVTSYATEKNSLKAISCLYFLSWLLKEAINVERSSCVVEK